MIIKTLDFYDREKPTPSSIRSKTKFSISLLALAIPSITFARPNGHIDEFKARGLRHRDTSISTPTLNSTNAPAAYAAICLAANSEVATTAIQNDIQSTTVNTIAIQSDFQNIASELSFIDNQNLVPSAPKFEPQWQELSQQWTNVLWASRTAASNIVAVCTEFTAVIMPAIANITDGEIPIHEAVEILNDFFISDGFTSLIGALTNFTESFTGYAGKLTESDEQMIQELQTEITALTANIKQLQIEMGAVGAALGAAVFVDVGLLYVFPEFSPVIIGAGLAAVGGSAIGFGLLETELESDYSQRSSDQNQIDALQEQLATIAQVNATLDSVKSQVDTMSGQLNVSTVIWNAVTSDIQQTIKFLQMGEGNVPLILWNTVNTTGSCYYGPISSAMNNYAAGITNSGIPPPTESSIQVLEITQAVLHAKAIGIVSKATNQTIQA
ncbi:hypothetical protein GGU10DRAFT_433646 [Lentinula aff. detonsa]|uniref:Uncharacterized protein n=1 Tax=Lentinula aff. detonsa TaxID=2804958 RepID=A0AA38KZY8_9AGAR|nr:hypothetical protein GGU10DRAFT_433646 [Lentinula aff. detonsa]